MYSKTIDEGMMVRYFSGEATAEEQRQLLAWINENPDNEQMLFILKDIYEASASANLSIAAQTDTKWNRIKNIVEQNAPPPSTKY